MCEGFCACVLFYYDSSAAGDLSGGKGLSHLEYSRWRPAGGLQCFSLPWEIADLSALQLCNIISKETGGADIPFWLIELENLEERFTVITDQSASDMKSVLVDWIEGG